MSIFCLTDSQAALTWIKNNNYSYKQFIKNQMSQIQANSDVKNMNYIVGKENIADLALRRCTLKSLELTKDSINRSEWFL